MRGEITKPCGVPLGKVNEGSEWKGVNKEGCGAVLEKCPDGSSCMWPPAVGCLKALEECRMRDIIEGPLYI